jgi:GntR family transcriptional regulator, rspAB operon transcriptional repressor
MNKPSTPQTPEFKQVMQEESPLFSSVRSFLSTLDTNDESRLPQRAYLAIRHAIRHLKLEPGQTV